MLLPDSIQVLLKLTDLGVAALALTVLFAVTQILNKMVDRLDKLRLTDEEQTRAIEALTNEIRALPHTEPLREYEAA